MVDSAKAEKVTVVSTSMYATNKEKEKSTT